MFLNKNKSENYTPHATKGLMKLSKLISQLPYQELSSIEESEQPPSTILLTEFSKPVLDTKKINFIIKKGIFSTIRIPKEERNIKLILDTMKKYKGYEQFITLHKISEKSLIIMSALGKIENYKRGETIYAKKDIAENFYYIIKGKVLIKSIDQKKIIDEYENKIQDYKNKTDNKSNNNNFNKYNNNIRLMKNDKSASPINSLYSIDNSQFKNENSNSSSYLINNKNMDLPHNKMQKLEKKKLSSQLKINENNFIIKKNYDDIINLKRRKPLFYINNNDNNDKYKLRDDENNKNNNNELTEKKDIIIESFSELQQILEKQREQSIIINHYEEGNFFGEWELMYKKSRQNNAYAVEDTDLLVLDFVDFKEHFKNEMLLADFERKFFIKKIMPILNINYLPIMVPIFYSKGDVVYTEYDIANYFYIIYKGSGILKQLKCAKNKKDIMLNLNKLETLMIVDKGCIVGLECCKSNHTMEGNIDNVYYDNTFIINEENTLLFKINLEEFKINKEEIIKLKYWLKDLYQRQSRLIRNYKEKLFKPKINREIIIKNLDNQDKKYFYYRDPKKNLIEDSIGNNNKFPFRKKAVNININVNVSFNKNRFNSLNKENNSISKFTSNFNSYSKRSSFSYLDSSSGFSKSNSKEKAKSTQRKSSYGDYKTIEPFLTNNESISNKKSFNPINKRNSKVYKINPITDNKKVLTFSSKEEEFNEINDFYNKIKNLRNAKTKQKNKNENKNGTLDSFKRQKYEDSFYKLIFKKHYRKVSMSSRKKNAKKTISMFLYDSGQFDIPLLAFGFKKKKF